MSASPGFAVVYPIGRSVLAHAIGALLVAGCANGRLVEGLTGDDAATVEDGEREAATTVASVDAGAWSGAVDATVNAPQAPPAATVPPDAAFACATAAPPVGKLAIWLRAGVGYHDDGTGHVSAWDDQTGGPPAKAPSDAQRPTLVPNGLQRTTTLHFEGAPDDAHQQALQRSVPIDGLEEMTVVFVNATPILWKDDPTEWCHYQGCNAGPSKVPGIRAVSETGCSGTYQHVLWWDGAPDPSHPGQALDWSGVFLSPKQEGIGFRFGNTQKTYSANCCDIVHDDHVEWSRDASIGARFTTTVAIHDHLMNRLFVDGVKLGEIPVPGGVDPRVYAADRLDVGNGFGWVDSHNHGGDVAELLVYTRALPDADRVQVERYLDCNLFPDRALSPTAP